MDSLFTQGVTFKYSYANGTKSIDAMPSILSSIPMFVEPFILTSNSTNDISSLADALKQKGYYSAFFHGAPKGSMGFQAYAKSAGFDDYFGYEQYNNSDDFDGTWAIWDEEFLQFFAAEMGKMKQPFMTSVFTASSHDPYRIPDKYKGKFPKGKHPIQECIAYTDYSMRQFFKKMSQYEWYDNTLFVICADHVHLAVHDEYHTSLNRFSIPILFYQPGSNFKGLVDSIPVQQIDIMPSVLSYLNYDKPYFAYGQDVFTTKAADKFVIDYNNGIYQLVKGDSFQLFDGEKTKAVYNYKTDPLLKNNLFGEVESQKENEMLIKSIVQQYIERMTANQLRITK
jgi:phosphoglycerol transferase MdoB-like AlkP superfamily enzyme